MPCAEALWQTPFDQAVLLFPSRYPVRMAAVIRPARASDVDALAAIENAVFDTDRISRRSFRQLIERKTAETLIAESDGRVAGYAMVLFRTGSGVARLYSIATGSGFCRQGHRAGSARSRRRTQLFATVA